MPISTAASTDVPRATTRAGKVSGLRVGSVDAFLGIPYAAAPVGSRRWRPPQAVAPWSGERPATRFGPSAWQPLAPAGFGPWTSEFVVQGPVGEDCLYLNVWSPAEKGDATRPVLVWIHGGAFVQGSGSVAVYDGQALAARGAVVVTLNYRLGVLGFLAHPDLAKQSASDAYGNFGLQDQIAALRWVQANIAAFGGDPTAVTIAGQSAGAVSVHLLAASPLAKGLFQRAIALSGPPALTRLKTLDEAHADGLAFAAELKARHIDELRALSAEELTRGLAPTPRFMPMVDGALLRHWPPQHAGGALPTDVPMIVGQTADENSGLDPNYSSPDPAALDDLLQRCYGAHAAGMSVHYPAASPPDHAAAYRAASRDRWIAALWCWAAHRAKEARAPVYAYHFEHAPPGPDAARFGAFHTADVPYWMGTLAAAPQRGFSNIDRQVSDLASGYWMNFLARGNPNGEGLPHWPQLHPELPTMLRIGPQPSAGEMLSMPKLSDIRRYVEAGGSMTILP
jgi:para-nitrobenzyl esterase